MPQPDPNVETIFHRALQKGSAPERDAFLDGACGGDPDLRQRVAELLEAEGRAGTFLAEPSESEGKGTVIDRYKLLQRIGEGGFGVVYMAEQREPVKRKVALKIIKLGMDTEQVIARFEAERQALAMMEHPNIAKVFDAGQTDAGRPYFVMELVKGVPITEYCDTENLPTQARLRLFMAVCQAIQHAHQKGIIHRDIKPTNVLVTLHDGVPVPKVIDFGIAKATNAELTEKTLFTEFRQFIGTPEYMSPEQAEMSGLDIDSRSDIYSLGVLLYELLTGTTPLHPEELRSAGLGEMQRLIREEEPQKPSTRLSSLSVTAPEAAGAISARDIARHRRCDPRSLSRQLRGDVDWIVMKALEKDRTRRYETATELARDIGRHLSDEAVEASPPSGAYRLRKFVRRNRVGVLAGGFIAAALVVGLTLATLGFLRARHEAESTRAVADFYERMLTSLVPYRVGAANTRMMPPGPVGFADLTVADFLQQAEPSIAPTFDARPDLEASVRRTFGWTFAGLGRGEEALRQLGRASEMQRAALGPDHVETLRTVSFLAFAHYLRGHTKEAAETVRPNLQAHIEHRGRDHPLTFDSQRFLAQMLWTCGELEEAEALASDLVERTSRTLGSEHGLTLWARHTLALVMWSRGRPGEAEAMLRDIQASAAQNTPNNPLRALALVMHALVLIELERFDEAESRIGFATESTIRGFGESHPFLSHMQSIAAIIQAKRGDLVGAEGRLREIEAIERKRGGPDHYLTVFTQARLIGVLIDRGQLAEAEERARLLQDAEHAVSGENGTHHLLARALLGRVLLERGRVEEAGRLLGEVLEDAERLVPGGFLELPTIRLAYGRCLSELERRREAEAQLLQAYESMAEMRGAQHSEVRECAAALVALYDAWDRPEDADTWRSR